MASDGNAAILTARCWCGAVAYTVNSDPVDAKICHCKTCQTLHGAPMQWAALFAKDAVEFVSGEDALRFYNSELRRHERILPCKVSCAICDTLIADEGRNMWMAFPTLFEFSGPVPAAYRPTCHIFYGSRVMDIDDDLPKWEGHKNKSALIQ